MSGVSASAAPGRLAPMEEEEDEEEQRLSGRILEPRPAVPAAAKPPRTEQFALREQLLNETTGAAGATPASNEAAMLGMRPGGARKRGISRDLLG